MTPSGRGLGRKPDQDDPRDRLYGSVHIAPASIPVSVDLRSKLPPCFDQGQTESCGPNAGAALLSFFYPSVPNFSRLQIYYDVRVIEGDVSQDDGVETRDVLRVLQETGSAPEAMWPFDARHMFAVPTSSVLEIANDYTVTTYSRLQTSDDYLNCLASGFPFVLGFTVFESLDSDAVAKSGVLPLPYTGEKQLGGHDVLVVGYDTNFLTNPDFIKSGLSPSQVSNRALLIRNSWGIAWGVDNGHFWMPLEFAADPTNGGDAWTARLTSKETSMSDPTVAGAKIDPDEIAIAAQALRTWVNTVTYLGMSVGTHVTDAQLHDAALAAVTAVEDFRSSPTI